MATITVAARWSSPSRLQLLTRRRLPFSASFSSAAPPAAVVGFGWADALRVTSDGGHGDKSDLSGYFRKVDICNRGMGKKGQFVEFLVEDQVVGYIHKGFIEHLRDFHDIFTIVSGNSGNSTVEHVSFHSLLRTPEDRTHAIGSVIKSLGEIIPGIRNELYPVTSSYGMPVYFSLERAAAPYFGIKAYGVHMNGYVEKDGQKFLWIAKRSDVKQTYPGMLDHLVAGGLPYGISCKENIIKECEEEAGIPRSISTNATSVGAISYMDIEGFRYKRDVLFCYDLKLPADFVPNNEDGEVDSFRLIPVQHAANIIRRTEFFKPNCNLVIIDFLFRHGYIHPDSRGYLDLLQSLRSGDCS
ncbi:Nudix hydrolase 20, chloroplastic [Dichanthelium oligosanthes]|uniref:Nudix hydrolase 20, chloroplastic n=1 Tax=Dichanthelium oligosanthes TaxID=888268 RepID=A0A1E5V9K4_9POAL|nr:Nudix hydrolase 20, chloroplastic [Dichanthelium oligosanthes]